MHIWCCDVVTCRIVITKICPQSVTEKKSYKDQNAFYMQHVSKIVFTRLIWARWGCVCFGVCLIKIAFILKLSGLIILKKSNIDQCGTAEPWHSYSVFTIVCRRSSAEAERSTAADGNRRQTRYSVMSLAELAQ